MCNYTKNAYIYSLRIQWMVEIPDACKLVRPLYVKYVPSLRHRITRETEMPSDTNKS